MLLNDGMLPLRGEVLLRVLDTRGKCIWRHHDKNTITYMAPLVIMDLLTQGALADSGVDIDIGTSHPADSERGFVGGTATVTAATSNALRYMRVGTGNGAAVRAEFALNSEVADDDGAAFISSIEYPTNASMRFTALFGSDKANLGEGSPICEVSLWTRGSESSLVSDVDGERDTRMFARQIHPAVVKTDVIQIEYTWTIFFT